MRELTKPLLAAVAAGAIVAAPAAGAAAEPSGWVLYGGLRGGSGFESASAPDTPLHLRSGAAFSLALERPYDEHRLWQFFGSRQSTRLVLGGAGGPGAPAELALDVTYLHAGGVNYFDGPVGRGFYVMGGIGLTLLSPRLPGTGSRLRWSMNLGLGHEWPLSNTFAVRLEARGYATLIRSQGSFFCSGGCTVSIQGDTLTQGEAMLGLRMAF